MATACPKCACTLNPPSATLRTELNSLLRGNHHPSESPVILKHLSDLSSDLEIYDKEISRLKALLISLENQRAETEAYEKDFQSLLSPIRKLPIDILEHVFLQFCISAKGFSSLPLGAPALILSSVCTHWRSTCLSGSELWSYIAVDTTYAGFSDAVVLPSVKTLVDRSGDRPLTIAIRDGGELVEAGSVVHFLSLLSSRWVSAYLDVKKPNGFIEVAGKIEFPLLERVTLMNPVGKLFGANAAPKVRLVRAMYPIGTLSFRWSIIEHLHVCRAVSVVMSVMGINPHNTKLAELTLQQCDADLVPEGTLWTIPNLTKLSVISNNGFKDAELVFRHCALPRLTSLELFSDYLSKIPSIN